MMMAVCTCPGVAALVDLQECLDFGSAAWVAVFARLGGADLLLQARSKKIRIGYLDAHYSTPREQEKNRLRHRH